MPEVLAAKNLAGAPRQTRFRGDGRRLWAYGRSGEACFKCGDVIQLRRQGEAGRVTLRVLIDEQGRPAELRVQSSSGYARLDEAALEALRDARFRPYAENGVAQRVWALVPIHFDLEN